MVVVMSLADVVYVREIQVRRMLAASYALREPNLAEHLFERFERNGLDETATNKRQ